MPTSSYSPQFNQHWLAMPFTLRQAFYQELDDIIKLLENDVPLGAFAFTYQDFDTTIDALLPVKDVAPADAPTLEETLYANLSGALDERLDDKLQALADELKQWLQSAIKDELAKQQNG